MFVVLTLSTDSIFVEIPSLSKYKYVALLKIVTSQKSSVPVYVSGDFVESSFVEGKRVGLIGTSEVQQKAYIPINIRRNTLGIKLTSSDFASFTGSNTKLILHFKK